MTSYSHINMIRLVKHFCELLSINNLLKLLQESHELQTVEILTSTLASLECFNRIPYVKVRLVDEAGSLIALA
jgi:hypothetical protein